MKTVDTVSLSELKQLADKMYGTLVKVDVDIAKNIIVIDMDMHADGEAYLLENGSKQDDLWGINLHPDKFGSNEFIEFDSMINIRPRQNNPSRDVLDEAVRTKICRLIDGAIRE